jgi:hypothetical protein
MILGLLYLWIIIYGKFRITAITVMITAVKELFHKENKDDDIIIF